MRCTVRGKDADIDRSNVVSMSRKNISAEVAPSVFESTELPDGVMRVVRAVILTDIDSRPHVLMGYTGSNPRRPKKRNKLEFIGGQQDPGHTLIETIIKEVLEEAHIKVEPPESGIFLGASILKDESGSPHGGKTLEQYGFAIKISDACTPVSGDEHDHVSWIPLGRVVYESGISKFYRSDTHQLLAGLAAHDPNFATALTTKQLSNLGVS